MRAVREMHDVSGEEGAALSRSDSDAFAADRVVLVNRDGPWKVSCWSLRGQGQGRRCARPTRTVTEEGGGIMVATA